MGQSFWNGLREAIVALGILSLCSVVAGCATESLLSPDELAAIHDGKTAVILLRFEGEDQNGDPFEPFPASAFGARDGYLKLAVGDFETGGVPEDITDNILNGPPSYRLYRHLSKVINGSSYYRLLSKQAHTEGWVVLFRPPGDYYLTIWAPLEPAQPNILWRIEVPPGVSVVYAGSFRLKGITEKFLCCWAKAPFLHQIVAAVVVDESTAATEEARRDLSSLSPPITRLAVLPYGTNSLGVPPPAQ